VPAFRVTVAYDGTDLVGWQRQLSGTSVQGLLEDALSALDGVPVAVIGAGRTDAGVHALGQVASFHLTREIEATGVVGALNARLPDTIRVMEAELVPADFHARFSATGKTYRYQIWHGDVLPPFVRRFAWHLTGSLDVAVMDRAARLIEGRRDFSAFQSTGSSAKTTERTIARSRVHEEAAGAGSRAPYEGRLVVYDVTGNGFLRHMVRAIVGSLVEVGRGRRTPEWLSEVAAAGARGLAGPTAPPQGLFLARVDYNRGLERGSVHVA
jgi:tRNA pseudouridine38-40 synthase